MLNKVILMGRLTADPEVKQTPNGISVCSFSLAVDRGYVKPGEERQADFINLVAWRNNAEFIGKYFAKGRLILVEGEINTRRYTDSQGNKRTAFEVVVDKAHFCDSKPAAQNNAPAAYAQMPPVHESDSMPEDFSLTDDEDLPF